METQPPKPITDVKPVKSEGMPDSSQAPAASHTDLPASAAQKPMQTTVATQSVSGQPLEVRKAPGEPTEAPKATTEVPSAPQTQQKPKKPSPGVPVVIVATVLVMILLSGLAIFTYINQNK